MRAPADVSPSIALDDETRALVLMAARIAVADEAGVRAAVGEVLNAGVNTEWVEETILQTYLFAGFPRALNAMREWRRASGRAAPAAEPPGELRRWRAQGEATCATVYGEMYARLRVNIRALHPALDDWMVEEGYGKVLSRPGLDLKRRELCIVGVCAASRQERQLHSHLHGALNAGASPGEVEGALDAVSELTDEAWARGVRHLWARVRDNAR